MAIPRGLREALLKYQKSRTRPLSQGVPAYAGQSDFVRPVTRVPGDDSLPITGSNQIPRTYMSDFPTDYIPNVGFMEIPEPDYGPYVTSVIPEPISSISQGFVGMPQDFEVKYEDSLMTQELFEHLMASASESMPTQLDSEQMAELQANRAFIEQMLNLEELSARLLPQGESIPEVPLATPVADVNGQLDFLDSLPAAQPLPGQINYGAMDPQDFFEQQNSMLESQFSQFDLGGQMEAMFNAQEALFDQSQQADLFSGPTMHGAGSLDDIIEHNPAQHVPTPAFGSDLPAYGDSLMTPELFEQQMHEAAEQMGLADPYMESPAYDMPGEMYDQPGPMQEEMYDQPPEPMPEEMMDPQMMPGPMGPNYMPDPPPGP